MHILLRLIPFLLIFALNIGLSHEKKKKLEGPVYAECKNYAGKIFHVIGTIYGGAADVEVYLKKRSKYLDDEIKISVDKNCATEVKKVKSTFKEPNQVFEFWTNKIHTTTDDKYYLKFECKGYNDKKMDIKFTNAVDSDKEDMCLVPQLFYTNQAVSVTMQKKTSMFGR
uniref:Uncharacterized protein n=1 Tax=Romanomermis culicivorax TaxID=13658 RepID=A0A915I1X6_ROMCU